MRSKVADRILSKMPDDTKIFVNKYADLVVRINQIQNEKGITQKSLAEKMGKKPSEICKWLSGEHNFTLRSIAKLEAELGELLLEVPERKPIAVFSGSYFKTTYTWDVFRKAERPKEKIENWEYPKEIKRLGNVG